MDEKTIDIIIKEVELLLATKIFDARTEGKITQNEEREMARFILSKTTKITDYSELMPFLEELAQKWNLFSDITSMEKLKMQEIETTDKGLAEVKDKIAQLNS